MNLTDYGFESNMISENSKGIPARVTEVHRERYAVVCDAGEGYARLKSSVYYGSGNEEFPTVGDFVMIDFNNSGDSQIIATLPRRSFFSRRNPTLGRGEQAVAANFDYVFILQSLNHDFNTRRLERYLAISRRSGGLPVIVLTKADLIEDYRDKIREAERVAAGAAVFAVSAKSGYGLIELSGYLKPGKTVVFLGSSGVGKSSLLNALAGEEIMTTSAIREDDSRGRHTTTHRQLVMLPSGAMIIDTPGMRELGMWETGTVLDASFPDIERYLGQCRFSDCTHKSEPGCAILEALSSGELSAERWESYRSLVTESEYAEGRAAYLRKKQQWHKEISKRNKEREAEQKRMIQKGRWGDR